jgi:hypothetical protein
MKALFAKILLICVALCASAIAGTKVTFDENHVMEIDRKKLFIISFSMAPPVDGKTPDGKPALAELRAGGGNFIRTTQTVAWDDAVIAEQSAAIEQASKFRIYCWPSLRECAAISENAAGAAHEAMLRRIITRLKDNPGLGGYKGVDEPAWGKVPVAQLLRARAIIKSIDPDHPIFVLHAPRNEISDLRPYNPTCDVTGADIFPIGYPPGMDSRLPNHEISCVADYTARMMEVADRKLPVMMALGIAWSGVAKPGKTLRMPTFHEMRYMSYAAIIKGARGINYFGGTVSQALSPEDARLGWNWTYWNHVLRRMVEEIGDRSPLYPALIGPDSKLSIKMQTVPETENEKALSAPLGSGPPDVDLCAREVEGNLYILAAKREGRTMHVKFTGLPGPNTTAEVLYESPRTVAVENGGFSDWFAPNEVHVYRIRK